MSTDWKTHLGPKPGEPVVFEQFPDVLATRPGTEPWGSEPPEPDENKRIVELHDQIDQLQNKITALELLGKRSFGCILALEQQLGVTPEQSTKARPEIWQAIMEFYEPARQQWQLIMESAEANPPDWKQWLEKPPV